MHLHVGRLSGEHVSIEVDPSQTVADFMKLLESLLNAPVLALLEGSGQLRRDTRLSALKDGAWTTVVHAREDRCYKQRRIKTY